MTISEIFCIAVAIISIAAFSQHQIISKCLFVPYAIKRNGEWFRFFSSAFIHADYGHLIFNLIALWSFGNGVEQNFAHAFPGYNNTFFMLLLILSMPASSLRSYYKHRNDENYAALGASGVASAVIFSAIMFDPYMMLSFYFIIPIPGIVFGILYLVYSQYMSKRNIDNVGHDIHFDGALFGIAYTLLLSPHTAIDFINKLF